jgi:Fic family protein
MYLLDGSVAADVAEAENAIARLNAEVKTFTDTEVLARLLLRAESVASSRIEGLEIGSRRLLRAELERHLEGGSRDVTASEVLANVDAMRWGIDAAMSESRITVDLLLQIHKRLLSGSRIESYGGRLRTEQNWIGGSNYNPCSAEFVPPPPEEVSRLLVDLCDFCSTDDLPATVQAAIAHAQFETIHPFVDGNGRTGRILVQVILRRRGLAPRVFPPVSLILATWAKDYVNALTATRYIGSPDSNYAKQGINRWVGLFATACRRAVEDVRKFEARTHHTQMQWRARVGDVRKNSALDLLLQALPGTPVLTVSTAAEGIDRSFQATNSAVLRLLGAGVVNQITIGRRNRAFEVPEIIDAFSDLERQLASPEGNTRSSAPARHVPPRRQPRSPQTC